jgi:uncharacterized protein DUF5916
LSLLSVGLAALLLAQGVAPRERPAHTAVRINPDERVNVDGKLDETSWQRAQPVTEFIQQDPDNGQPASERTELRVLFDRENLYIGVECLDSDPGGLLFNQMMRDGSLDGDDRFMWVLDSYNTQQSAYYFEVNPAGAMGDALVVPSQGGNFGSALNRAWDGIWLAKVQRHERGWTVEIQIPFKTLNFDPGAESWGANFQRTIRRKNEEVFWSGFARNQGLLVLTGEGQLQGISDVTQGVGLDVKPYLLGSRRVVVGDKSAATNTGTGGVDLFYNVTPQLKVNLTVNTDFAQTEVDDRQVNLTRFGLFFPEKREFFLEGSRYFDFSREPNGTLSEFFSRRIGLDDNGLPQKIDYGTKLTGQVGRYDLGFIQARTASERGMPGEDFTVFRPQRRLLAQSSMGFLYTRRAARNSSLPVRQSFGGDFELATSRFRGGRQNFQVAGHFAKTTNPAKPGHDNAYGWRVNYPNDLINTRFVYRVIEPNHDPALGYRDRTGYHAGFGVFRFGPRPKNSRFIRQIATQFSSQLYTDMNYARTDSQQRWTPLEITFQTSDRISFQLSDEYDRLDENFQISKGVTLPAGTHYSWNRYQVNLDTANRRTVSTNSEFVWGTFYSGHRRDITERLNLRVRRGLSASMVGQFNRIELREGSFSTKILRAVVNTQFSPFLSLANNVQYDTSSRVLGWQIRFRWIMRPGNDIYFVALNNWMDNGPHIVALDRNMTAKIVYTQRF